MFRQHAPALVIILDKKFEGYRFLFLLVALHPITPAFILKLQDHLGSLCQGVDDHFILSTCFAKQCPGDGVQQGGLPCPVGTRDASQVNIGKVNFHRFQVGKKTRYAQVNWNHDFSASLLFSSGGVLETSTLSTRRPSMSMISNRSPFHSKC